ncbi:zonular occludens toxin domain-containing protein [Vibrio intestinalis]|uniref:zonular occludens toxin domain-containing protein n=1 Tax=Vibrio intestinalis TaxID=2933291 RepID=UPI0021A8F616|nr:zonular occludens toxin domain-containing protein [Vibrio intestinalis]
MIYALVGRPRSGKSYEAVVFHIIPAIASGRKVITNIPINIEKMRKIFGDKADLIEVREGKFNEYNARQRPFSMPEEYETDWRNDENQGPLFIVDEAHMVLGRQLDNDILYFYSMHGHHGIDIILVTQNLRKIHKDIKDMIELTYYCVKNTHLGTDKTYTRKNYLGFELKNPISEEKRTYEKKYFGFYQSHTASNKAVKEALANDTKSVYNTWSTKLGAIFIVGGLVAFALIMVGRFSGNDETIAETQVHQSSEVAQPEQQEPDGSTESKRTSKSQNVGFGLLEDYQFFVSGWSKQLVKTVNGIDADESFYRVYVDVYLENRYQFTLKHSDLFRLGYQFTKLSDCVYQMKYFDISRVVVCRQQAEAKDDNKSVEDVMKLPSIL